MKIISPLAVSAFVLTALVSCQNGVTNKAEYHISGHLDNITTDTLLVLVTNAEYTKTEYIDTVPLTNGDFAFNLEGVQEMRSIVLTQLPAKGKKLMEDGYEYFIFMPGERADISGTLENMKVTGTGFYNELNKAEAQMPDYRKESKLLNNEYKERIANGEDRQEVQADIKKKMDELNEQMAIAAKTYIANHPDSDVSTYLIGYLGDNMDEGLALLTERAKEGPASAYYKSIIARQETQKKRDEAAKNIQPGLEAPDFTLNDLNSKPLSLSSLRGKYVVLDFWGSWCGWCIKGFPEMKKAYAKHQGKVEFLGIACGDTEQKWKEAVAKHEIPWLNVLNENGDKDVSTIYGVQAYPTKIVIDPQGKIAKVIVGEAAAFYTYLDGLFN